jgi:hypothetical protein
MTAIPAKVAGVPEVVLCVPPGQDRARPPGHAGRRRHRRGERGVRRGWRPGRGGHGLRHRDHPPGRRHRRSRQRVRGHRQARGGRSGGGAVVLPRPVRGGGHRRRHRPGRPGRGRRHPAGRARPRWPGLADLVVGGRAQRHLRRDRGPGGGGTPAGRHHLHLRRGRATPCCATRPNRRWPCPTPSPPSTSSSSPPTREALVPLGAPRRRGVLRAVVAGVGGRLPRRPQPRAAHRRHRPVRFGAHRERLREGRPRHHPRSARRVGAGRAGGGRHRPTPRAWPPTPTACGAGSAVRRAEA